MVKLIFQHHYSSLQCHMTLQKSFQYADLLLKAHFFTLSMLKTVVLLNIIVETVIDFFFLVMNRIKRTAFIW